MAAEPRERDRAGLDAWAERYAAVPERPSSFTTLSGEPIQPLYTEADLPARPIRSACPASTRSRAACSRRCTAGGCGRCACSRASARPSRPTSASTTCSSRARPGSRTAFDFPTLMGYDSDSPRSLGEVGSVRRGRRHAARHGGALRRHPARARSHVDDHQRPGGVLLALLRRARRQARHRRASASAARCRTTASRSSSRSTPGWFRRARRCASSPT